jgi:NAD(P)-dependent dehydrogenase (short-subunit alcohol dehydrogenase family)
MPLLQTEGAEMLEGKVALVTGAGRGLGRDYALALAKAGAKVVVNDFGGGLNGMSLDEDPAGQVVEEIMASGGAAVADRHSVADWDGARSMIATALQSFGRLDILVNNAGISRAAHLPDLTEEDVDLQLGVHLKGTLATTHFAAAHWRDEGPMSGRAIINITSAAGLHPNLPGQVYTACKAGIAAMTLGSSVELASLGVQVNAVAPCARTRMVENSPAVLALMPHRDGFDRHAAQHIAPLVVYLSSQLCHFTGRVFAMEGPDVAIYTPWSVEKTFHEADGWDVEALAQALADHPPQAEHMAFFPNGPVPFRLPPGKALKALARNRA